MAYRSTDLFITRDSSHSPSPSRSINSKWLLNETQDDIKATLSASPSTFELHNMNETPERMLPQLPPEARYRLRRHILRSLLNTLGPPVVLTIYALVVYFYIVNNDPSGVVPFHPLNARVAYYSWLVLSAFVLAWAKAGIAGYEAAALGRPSMAPANAARFMWHSDRIWSEFTGWCKAVAVCYRYLKGKALGRRNTEWDGPSLLWFYLALTSIVLHIAVPLAGLSMEFSIAMRLSDRPAIILGANETTFNSRPPDDIAEQANARWRLGNPTTPEGAAIIYAPDGTPSVSTTYFEDTIQDNYQKNLQNPSGPLNQTISFFTGPSVSERAYGRVWGFLNHLACTPVSPYAFGNGLKLLNVSGVHEWSTWDNLTTARSWNAPTDSQSVYVSNATMLGVTYHYVITNNYPPYSFDTTYMNASEFPLRARIELIMWQTFNPLTSIPDETFKSMSSHPLVKSSLNPFNNLTYLGYGVSCAAQSSVGLASISTTTNTYSDFSPLAANKPLGEVDLSLVSQRSGTPHIHALVYDAFTSVPPELTSPKCDPSTYAGCDGWAGANRATNGVPIFFSAELNPTSGRTSEKIQLPSISPERMTLAMQKLFGEAAIAAMSTSTGNWTSSPSTNSSEPTRFMYGLQPVPNIIPGIIHYMYPLVLLAIWVLLTVLPQLHPTLFFGRRWGPILDGITMFRLGAEWTGHVHRLHTGDLLHLGNTSLRGIPGMIGDMNDTSVGIDMSQDRNRFEYKRAGAGAGVGEAKMRMMAGTVTPSGIDAASEEFGFVGLSTRPARCDRGRYYTLKR
ncbi:hypothetical protein V8F20_005895 [Naviculisporaceae sp. PSN 640]